MCGIAGFSSGTRASFDSAQVLRAMTDQLVHRGPDDVGYWIDPRGTVALGHRRLSILDLSSAGHQPMVSPAGRFHMVFNGELYNFREIKGLLVERGISFRSDSDTEVALAAFDVWGVEASVKRFVGMFAFAVWDSHSRSLHLVRDRIGEKPLYYALLGTDFVFGSELKSLRRHPAWHGAIDKFALASFFRLGYVFGERSIYEGVRKIAPGTIVTLTSSLDLRVTTYWSGAEVARRGVEGSISSDVESITDELDAALRTSVRGQMIADVPLGAFLSGGVDSSLIVALMQSESSIPVRTYTIGFDNESYNETEHARNVARHLGTEHTEFFVTEAEARDVIPMLPRLYDEPFADSSQIPTHLVSALARRHVTVSLSGDGGDELFGGYARYLEAGRVLGLLRSAPAPVRRGIARLLRQIPPAALAWMSTASSAKSIGLLRELNPSPSRIARLADVLVAADMDGFYEASLSHWKRTEDLIGVKSEPLFSVRPGEDAGLSGAEQMMLRDLLSYLPDDILVKVDRASMGVSLETRAPFLDHRVVELAWRIPLDLKIREGKGKWILRRLLDRYVPRSIIERPKMGFGVPLAEWLRGPLSGWAEDLLDPRRLESEGVLNASAVSIKWREHKSGKRNWQYLLWDVLMFQAWFAENSSERFSSISPTVAA
jgi:asparagine synthase (glutamine-hydrolysing)